MASVVDSWSFFSDLRSAVDNYRCVSDERDEFDRSPEVGWTRERAGERWLLSIKLYENSVRNIKSNGSSWVAPSHSTADSFLAFTSSKGYRLCFVDLCRAWLSSFQRKREIALELSISLHISRVCPPSLIASDRCLRT